MVLSRGPRPSVMPGGRGFKCLKPECETFFDTAEAAIAHAEEAHGIASDERGGREYDAQGRTRCLWDGCGKVIMASGMVNGKWRVGSSLGHVRSHEAKHEKGDPPKTGFVCPEPDCDSARRARENGFLG